MKKINKSVWVVLSLCGLAALLRLWGLSNGLPDVLHPDENMLVRRAVRFGTGDFNPHFFYYPSLSIYLYFVLHGLYFVFGLVTGAFHSTADLAKMFFTDPTWFYLLPRLLICLSDVLSVYFIMRIGSHLLNDQAGGLAGFMWATFPQGLSESQVAKPDALMVSLALLSLWLLLEADTRRKILIAGLVLGLSVSAKYQSVITVPVLMLWLLLKEKTWREQAPVTFLFGVAVVIGFVVGTPFSVLSPREFLKDFQAQSEVMRIGMFGLEGGARGWTIYLKGLIMPGGSPPLGLMFLLGAVFCLRNRRDVVLIVLGIPVILFLGLGVQRIASVHYLYLAYPFVFLLSGLGFIETAKKITRNGSKYAATAAALLAVSLFPFYVRAASHMKQYVEPDTRISSREWIEKNIPPGSVVLVDASAPSLKMTTTQLETLYQRAKAAGHVKADYFALMKQYTSEPTYTVYLTKQGVMLSPKNLVEYSRAVQDLIPIENGLAWIKNQGIAYAIVSSQESDQYGNPAAREQHPNVAAYYDDVRAKGTLLAEFKKGPNRTGPTIEIYKL